MRFKSFLQYNTLPYQKKGFSYLIYNKIYISASYKKAFWSNGEPSWELSPKTVAHNSNCSLFLWRHFNYACNLYLKYDKK